MKAEIKLINNQFNLIFLKKILNSILFQINFYGFHKKENTELVFLTTNKKAKILDLISFLRKENYNLILCEKTNVIIKEHNFKKEEFIKNKNHLNEIKKIVEQNKYKKNLENMSFLKRQLKDHQKKSYYHLSEAKSAANFSVPGSGKTSVVLAFYEKLKLEKKIDAILVIGPKNCYNSWDTEFKLTLGRDPNISILDGNKKDRLDIYNNFLQSELYTCHFMTVSNDLKHLQNFLSKKNFLIVIDEAHNIKKIDGVWSRAILSLSHLTKYKVILTGTPNPQNYTDFYNYMEFLYNENEIFNLNDKTKIEILMEDENYDEASSLINKRIYPYFTRITKKELNLSKPNFIKPYRIKMNPIENKIHEAIITRIKYYSKKDYLKNIDLIRKIHRARVIRLKQACSYVKNLITAIPDESLTKYEENYLESEDLKKMISTYDLKEKPAKLIELISLVKKLTNNNKKVLIWSTHLKTIDLIKKEFDEEKIEVETITGKTPLDLREKIKNKFNDKNSKLQAIIAIPQACSESISLHKACQNSIYYDQNYNTAEFLQSLDRIHRVGGSETNPVYYHFLQYENSIDIKVYERVFKKANRMMQVIETGNLTFSNPDEDDFKGLYAELNL